MKSKWIKGLVFLGIAILIIVAAKAAMFYGGGHPAMQRMQGEVRQLQQNFQNGAGVGAQHMEIRGKQQGGMKSYANHPERRDHKHSFGRGGHHKGGFWLGSLLTIAFWGGLLYLAFRWLKKRRTNAVGSNILVAGSIPSIQEPSTNEIFLDQWEKEQTKLKEDN